MRTDDTRQDTTTAVYSSEPKTESFEYVDISPPNFSLKEFRARYSEGILLGRGGMGEVKLYRDHCLGRDVAVKVMVDGKKRHPDTVPRFLTEARVQGQLEHPAIVPVYDLGITDPGQIYFTMKRVRGNTLKDILDPLGSAAAEFKSRFGRRRLLSAFSQICLAVDFAHKHGVVHRDLKPANIMLGDFGEVYVLDWGIAKILGSAEESGSDAQSSFDPNSSSISGSVQTATGDVVGTLGYIAPERLFGKSKPLTVSADIYALGVILFEILTHERLHVGSSAEALLASTLMGVNIPERALHIEGIAPELIDLCARATRKEPSERVATARELHEAIESYLDGDRDRTMRQALAQVHLQQAQSWINASESESADYSKRSHAMQSLARAIALDPTDQGAMALIFKVLSTPTRDIPQEAQAALQASSFTQIRLASRAGAITYGCGLLCLPFWMWTGLQTWAYVLIAGGCIGLALLCLALNARLSVPRADLRIAAFVSSTLGMLLLTKPLEPYALVPGIIAVNTMGYAVHRDRKQRLILISLGCFFATLPFILEWFHPAVTPTYIAENPPAFIFLLVMSWIVIFAPSWFIGKVHDHMRAAEEQLELQAWHLKQWVPKPIISERPSTSH